MATPSPIGERLARLRNFRGLTQEELAEKAGISVDVIRRLEQARRKTARWSTLTKLAKTLDVELSTLVTPPSLLERSHGDSKSGLLEIRCALTASSELPGMDDYAEDDEVPSLDELGRSVAHAWKVYQSGEFSTLSTLLPTLITAARRATREYDGDQKAAAYSALATTYNMGAGVTVMLGHEDLAFTAVERSVAASRHADDPLCHAASAVFLSWILLKQGRYDQAERAAVTMAENIEPSFTKAPSEELATFGNLLVNGSAAAVRDDRGERADDLLSVARAAAARVGEDRVEQWSVFGPRVVGMYAANNAVELGDMERALHLAEQVPPAVGVVPVTWEARYSLNMAYAQVELRRDTEAVDSLWQARTVAPEWIKYPVLGHWVVRELLDRGGRRREPRLATLADHLKVVV